MRSKIGLLAPVSGFNPASVGTVAAWYDPSKITGHVDGDTLTSVSDLSGNAHTLSGSAAYKTNRFGSLPSLQGTGSQYLSTSTFLTSAANVTVACVFKTAAAMSNKYLWSFASTGDGNGFDLSFTNTTLRSHLKLSIDALTQLDFTLSYATSAIWVALVKYQQGDTTAEHGMQVSAGNDAESLATFNTSNGQTMVSNNVFTLLNFENVLTGTFGFTGDLGEVLVYSSALTTTTRNQIRSYLGHKWGAF